jgi:hypothetical protein
MLPFCTKVTLRDSGVLPLKAFSQFAVIWATAAAVFVAAGGADARTDDTGADEPEDEREPVQAATAAARARASAGTRIRRARTVNLMKRLPGRSEVAQAAVLHPVFIRAARPKIARGRTRHLDSPAVSASRHEARRLGD